MTSFKIICVSLISCGLIVLGVFFYWEQVLGPNEALTLGQWTFSRGQGLLILERLGECLILVGIVGFLLARFATRKHRKRQEHLVSDLRESAKGRVEGLGDAFEAELVEERERQESSVSDLGESTKTRVEEFGDVLEAEVVETKSRMKLQDFVSETIVSIMNGVAKAQADNKSGGHVNPRGTPSGLCPIEFDIAIASSERQQGDVGGGIYVSQVVRLGAKGRGIVEAEGGNRIKFSIPVTLPTDRPLEDQK